MKKIIFLFLLVLLTNFCSALEIGITPAEINIDIYEGETICKNITLFSSTPLMFSGQDFWNKENTRNLADYASTKPAEITLNYTKRVLVDKNKTTTICISAKEQGKYSSALVYTTEQGSAAVGTWLNITANSKTNKTTFNNILTGSAIKESSSYLNPSSYLFVLLLLVLFFLLVILLVILYKKEKVKTFKK